MVGAAVIVVDGGYRTLFKSSTAAKVKWLNY